MTKHPRALLSIALIALVTISPDYTQQERQYTVTIPARLVNQHLMLIRGQLDQLTAQDFRDLQNIEEPQIYAQYRQYGQMDSVAQARQRAVRDSSKIKKP